MGRKHPDEPRRPFAWRRAAVDSARNSAVGTAGNLAAAVLTIPEPMTMAAVLALGFAGGAVAGMAMEYVKHLADDPLPIFDGRTTFLFDTVFMIAGFLLLTIPAFRLDLMIDPGAGLPGGFGMMAFILTVGLIPLVRGLICNLGLAREEDERIQM